MSRRTVVWILALMLSGPALRAAEPGSSSPDVPSAAAQERAAAKGQTDGKEKAASNEVPEEDRFVSKHSVRIDGHDVAYTATAGTLLLHDNDGKPTALMGYVAYTRNDVKNASRRPLTFAYNGGPGSSSIWLHMGALGPRRVVTADASVTPPPPYQVVDNAYSVIDDTDLVMIDPVGTGVSHAVGEKKDKDFWSVDADVASVCAFIKRYVGDNDRWNSPKFLIGESYGTTRSAAIVNDLQSKEGMAFNGVVLVSVALDIEAIFDDDWAGNDRPYPFFVPSYAAVAWYHRVLADRPERLEPFLDEVRRWALGPYASALLEGDALPDDRRAAIARQLAAYTGLSVDYVESADLRISEPHFTQELLREHREIVGRLDARFTGLAFDPLAAKADYDPMSTAIGGAFTAAFLDYYHRDLGFPRDREYHVMVPAWKEWDWRHRVTGAESTRPQPVVNTRPDLAHALGTNPNLRVLALNGYFDLATPFLATEYTMTHLGLPAELAAHVTMKYYAAGHMMYLHEPALAAMKKDIAAFLAGEGSGTGATAEIGGSQRAD